jgi:hypothetical protein
MLRRNSLQVGLQLARLTGRSLHNRAPKHVSHLRAEPRGSTGQHVLHHGHACGTLIAPHMGAPSDAGAAHDQGERAPAGVELIGAAVYALGVHAVPGPLADGAMATVMTIRPHAASGVVAPGTASSQYRMCV